MTEQSKFAGALGRLKKTPVAVKPGRQTEKQPITRIANVPEPIRKGRQAGKRSNPEFSPTTFFIRKETKRNAFKLLLDDPDAGQDLSDLVEQLLSQWVSARLNV